MTTGSAIRSTCLTLEGGGLFSFPITDGATYALDELFPGVHQVRVTDADTFLNLSELRVFTEFNDGVVVPEPGSAGLLAFGLLATQLFRRRH